MKRRNDKKKLDKKHTCAISRISIKEIIDWVLTQKTNRLLNNKGFNWRKHFISSTKEGIHGRCLSKTSAAESERASLSAFHILLDLYFMYLSPAPATILQSVQWLVQLYLYFMWSSFYFSFLLYIPALTVNLLCGIWLGLDLRPSVKIKLLKSHIQRKLNLEMRQAKNWPWESSPCKNDNEEIGKSMKMDGVQETEESRV